MHSIRSEIHADKTNAIGQAHAAALDQLESRAVRALDAFKRARSGQETQQNIISQIEALQSAMSEVLKSDAFLLERYLNDVPSIKHGRGMRL